MNLQVHKRATSHRILLFGAGGMAEEALNRLISGFEIIAFVDNDPTKMGKTIRGLPILSPDQIKAIHFDFVYITSVYVDEIKAQLIGMGIDHFRIRVFKENDRVRFNRFPPRSLNECEHEKIAPFFLQDSLCGIEDWNCSLAEKALIGSFLEQNKPCCSVIVSPNESGIVEAIARFSKTVLVVGECDALQLHLRDKGFKNIEFVGGDEAVENTLPSLFREIQHNEKQYRVELIFVDGANRRWDCASDISAILSYQTQSPCVLLINNASHPETRQGIVDVLWENHPYVHYVDLDFYQGQLSERDFDYRELVGGLAMVSILREKRTHKILINQSMSRHYDACYNGSNHSHQGPNPFSKRSFPMFPEGGSNIRFSAVIPNYNDADLIEGAIDEMLAQSRPPDELVVCDDGSTDQSLELLQKLSKRHPTLRIIKNQSNMGVIPTINRLLREAKGDYIYFGSADDRVLPLFFENILFLLEKHPSAPLGMAAFYSVDQDDEILGFNHVRKWKQAGYFSSESCHEDYFSTEEPSHSLSSGTIYHRRSLLEIGGFDASLGHWTDSFCIRTLCLKGGCVYSPNPGAKFLSRLDSFSGSQNRNLETSLKVIKNVAKKMRSKEFSNFFSDDHVSKWEARFIELAKQNASQH